MTELGWAIVAYLVVQLLITAFIGRFVKSETDFLLAGRSLGTALAAMSIFATWFGAETVMASSGAVATGGLSETRAEPFGYAICLILMAVLIAHKMRAAGYTTLVDLYRARYSNQTATLAAFIMIPTSLFWAAAQLTAFGAILHATMGVDQDFALMLAAGFVIVYTSLSGLMGDVVTDNMQGAIVMTGLGIILLLVVHQLGGFGAAVDVVDPAKLSLLKPDETWLEQTDQWAVPIIGSLVTQEIMSRMLGSKSARVARNACIWATVLYLSVGLIPVTLGLIGPALMPVPAEADHFLPLLAEQVLPGLLLVLFTGALTSAILSTINSNLLAVSAIAGHNLIRPLRPHMDEHSALQMDRFLVVAAGFATYALAMSGDSIYGFLAMSSSWGSAGLVIVMLIGIWSGFGGRHAAIATLMTGIAMTIVGQFLLDWDYAYLKALAACLLVFVAVGLGERVFLAPRQGVRTAI